MHQIIVLLLLAGSVQAQELHLEDGLWVNEAGGNLYGNSTLNPDANPNINPEANPIINPEANPIINPEANPDINPDANPLISPLPTVGRHTDPNPVE